MISWRLLYKSVHNFDQHLNLEYTLQYLIEIFLCNKDTKKDFRHIFYMY